MARVHRIFDVRGLRYAMEEDHTVKMGRRYRRWYSNVNLYVYYRLYDSDGRWHRTATLRR